MLFTLLRLQELVSFIVVLARVSALWCVPSLALSYARGHVLYNHTYPCHRSYSLIVLPALTFTEYHEIVMHTCTKTTIT